MLGSTIMELTFHVRPNGTLHVLCASFCYQPSFPLGLGGFTLGR